MLRASPILQRWQTPLYHKRALAIKNGNRWHGNFGGVSRFFDRTIYSEKLDGTKMVTMVDRECLSYMQKTRTRSYQLSRAYSRRTDSTYRKQEISKELRAMLHRKLRLSFLHYMQFRVMKNLEDKGKLVNVFGQAAVNRALGDLSAEEAESTELREKKWNGIRRKAVQTPMVNMAPKFQATMHQRKSDRFDMRAYNF